MKKLNLPSLESEDIFESVLKNSKDESKKSKLREIKGIIFERYEHYETNASNLERISSSPIIDAQEKVYLKSNYSRNKSGYLEGKVVSAIIHAQTPQLKSKCPYCGIDKPRTIDHYLPQSQFPEYSIYPKNLIPCCGYCNSKKSKRWLENGKRLFINYYFDDLPYNIIFLEVSLNYATGNNAPKIKYGLVDNGINGDEFELINSHFEKLDLVNEYESIAEEEISNIRQTILANLHLNNERHLENLNMSLKTLEKKYGINYWKSALYRAILRNEDFLNYIRPSHRSDRAS